jgi:hypothetical protein
MPGVGGNTFLISSSNVGISGGLLSSFGNNLFVIGNISSFGSNLGSNCLSSFTSSSIVSSSLIPFTIISTGVGFWLFFWF